MEVPCFYACSQLTLRANPRLKKLHVRGQRKTGNQEPVPDYRSRKSPPILGNYHICVPIWWFLESANFDERARGCAMSTFAGLGLHMEFFRNDKDRRC